MIERGAGVKLIELVRTSRDVGATRSRRAKVEAIGACLRALRPEERSVGAHYLMGALPQGRIGVGAAVVYGLSATTAAESGLTLGDVDRALERVAAERGGGAVGRRKRELGRLLERATAEEQAWLKRLLLGELRQGALSGLLVDAAAKAADVDIRVMRRAAMLAGSVPAVVATALSEGASGLSRFTLLPFRPIMPMLASPVADIEEAVERAGPAAYELKLDGARIQVHRDGDDIRIYSRRLHDVTDRLPDLVEAVQTLSARRLILDGEAIAWRPDGRPYPFQTTMSRFGTRREVEAMRRKLPLSPVFFDLLLLDDDVLLDEPAGRRFEAMDGALPEALRVPRRTLDGPEAVDRFYDEALALGHEGLMAKRLDAAYEAGSRGFSWMKIKPAHTLDLVVLAAEAGSGRRTGWLSNLHLGARCPDDNTFVMLGKTFKGLTDELLAWQTAELGRRALHQDGHITYVKPEMVVEVAFSDVQASPHYPAGLALRFARVKRYRGDKRAQEADTISTVRQIFEAGHGPRAGSGKA